MGVIDKPCGECEICGNIWLREQFTQNCEVCQRVICRQHLYSHRVTFHRAAGILDLAAIHVCTECLEGSLPERTSLGAPVLKTKFGESFEEPKIQDARQRLRKAVLEKLSLRFKECITEEK